MTHVCNNIFNEYIDILSITKAIRYTFCITKEGKGK